MQHNFILTDLMKTGGHQSLEEFINMNTLEDQHFEMTGEYYTLHSTTVHSLYYSTQYTLASRL